MGIQHTLTEVLDGMNRTGYGLIVHQDGSTDVNVLSCAVTLDVNVTGLPLPVSLVDAEIEPTVKSKPAANSGGTGKVGASSSSQTLISGNDNRTSFMVKNLCTTTIYVELGGTATTSSFPVLPNETVHFPVAYTGDVSFIGSAGDVHFIEYSDV